MDTNNRLHKAQKDKRDEFYTLYETIENEMKHYNFKNKHIYCNCDHPEKSNFYKYFKDHFNELGLKALTCTFYNEKAYRTTIKKNGKEIKETKSKLKGNGDYKSEECINILKKADIIITNPPFSQTKYFIPLMYKYKKDFIILGNQNTVTFKEIYPHILKGELRLGITIHAGDVTFQIPDKYELMGNAYKKNETKYAKVTGIRWLTNIEHGQYPKKIKLQTEKWNLKNNKALIKTLQKKYKCKNYPKYDNLNGIEVPLSTAIPMDYNGIVGVPITFLDKYNPNQFELVGFRKGIDGKDLKINGKAPYFRFLIRRKTGE